jgi:hypothetical protein
MITEFRKEEPWTSGAPIYHFQHRAPQSSDILGWPSPASFQMECICYSSYAMTTSPRMIKLCSTVTERTAWCWMAISIVTLLLVAPSAAKLTYRAKDGSSVSAFAPQLWYNGYWKHVRNKSEEKSQFRSGMIDAEFASIPAVLFASLSPICTY